MYAERDETKRAEYLDAIKDIKEEDLVYVDESGIDHNIIHTECWVEKGKEVIGERTGKRKVRTSIIAALNVDNINAPMRFQGATTTKVFLYWVENFLVPSLRPGQCVVMDNAAFHKSKLIKERIEKAGCTLIYLPPYSPDFNPIEEYWAVFKNYVKKIRGLHEDFFDAIDHALKHQKRSFQS